MASKKPIKRSVAVESTSFSIDGVYKQILSELKANKYKQEDIFAVHLALEEAFTNAITHGNEMSSVKKVRIDYSVRLDQFEASMIDEGEGFDPIVIPDPRYGENLYKITGRGLLLMHSYMDVVEFNKRGNGVRMVRYKEQPPLTEILGLLQG